MNITFPQWQSVYEKASWGVEQVKQVIGPSAVSYIALLGMNILCFEISVRICRAVNFLFKEKEQGGSAKKGEGNWKIGLLFTLIMTGTTFVCCKRLQLTFSLLPTVGSTFVHCYIYLSLIRPS